MKFTKKLTALLLAVLMLSVYSPFAFAVGVANDSLAESNTDFAIKTAEIIKDQNSMLRIIGKFRNLPSEDDFSLASESVISEDGRFVLQFSSEKNLIACLDMLNNNPDIIYAERDVAVYTEAFEETEYLSWGVKAIEADIYAQSINPPAGSSVTVAIVDSGCEDIDFIKDKLTPGYDFTDNDADAFEDDSTDSHGTFLASIIADCSGTLPIQIMPVRVLSSKTGSIINVVNGIIYAVDNGADVINISLGAVLKNCSSLEDAIGYAEENNVTVVVCAGNQKIDIKDYCPAHIEDVLTVSSINSKYEFSSGFSNYGDKIDFAAPGENIIGYNASGKKTTLSGTSMSTAFASAAVAMYRLENPACNTTQVREAFVACSKDFGDEGWDKYYGHGVLKLGKLIKPDSKPIESISFPQDTYEVFVGDIFTIEPIITPADADDKSFTLTASNSNISISGNTITAVSPGCVTITVTSNDGSYYDTAQITIKEIPPEIKAVLKIKNNPGTKTINYGETLRLTAEITDRPEDTSVWWYVDGSKTAEGETFDISPSGRTDITAKLVDGNGNAVVNSQGYEVYDSETVEVNSGLLQIIISILKIIFGLNRTVVQMLF